MENHGGGDEEKQSGKRAGPWKEAAALAQWVQGGPGTRGETGKLGRQGILGGWGTSSLVAKNKASRQNSTRAVTVQAHARGYQFLLWFNLWSLV